MTLVLPASAARIAGMDTGTKGAIAWRADGRIGWRALKLPAGPPGARWCELRRILGEVRAEIAPLDAFYFEESWFIGGHGTQVEAARHRFGCYAVLETWAYVANVPLLGVTPGQAKKALTGNGRAEKRDMIECASRLCGEVIADANAADAIGVLVAGLWDWDARQAKARRAA